MGASELIKNTEPRCTQAGGRARIVAWTLNKLWLITLDNGTKRLVEMYTTPRSMAEATTESGTPKTSETRRAMDMAVIPNAESPHSDI